MGDVRGPWHYVRGGEPAAEGDEYAVVTVTDYERLRADRAQLVLMTELQRASNQKLVEAAAFLDGLAERADTLEAAIRGMLEFYDDDPHDGDQWECLKIARRAMDGNAAADCRAKARQLRGEELVGIHEDKDDPDYKEDLAKLRDET